MELRMRLLLSELHFQVHNSDLYFSLTFIFIIKPCAQQLEVVLGGFSLHSEYVCIADNVRQLKLTLAGDLSRCVKLPYNCFFCFLLNVPRKLWMAFSSVCCVV